ncbi:MAG: hypothetical protein HY700_19815 [Gemmatimonadetes bacterium]|nr:hypothetical protein [Gemmatimonadota bacterium]
MPVTVKFSEQFYKVFGHEQVDELVNWCNQVDAAYRSEFRELFDTNFARLEAKLEQRIAEVRAELRQEMAALRTDLAQLESRLTWRMFLFWIATVGIVLLQKT